MKIYCIVKIEKYENDKIASNFFTNINECKKELEKFNAKHKDFDIESFELKTSYNKN